MCEERFFCKIRLYLLTFWMFAFAANVSHCESSCEGLWMAKRRVCGAWLTLSPPSPRRRFSGHQCKRGEAQTLVWLPQEQGQKDRALAHADQWITRLAKWLKTPPPAVEPSPGCTREDAASCFHGALKRLPGRGGYSNSSDVVSHPSQIHKSCTAAGLFVFCRSIERGWQCWSLRLFSVSAWLVKIKTVNTVCLMGPSPASASISLPKNRSGSSSEIWQKLKKLQQMMG